MGDVWLGAAVWNLNPIQSEEIRWSGDLETTGYFSEATREKWLIIMVFNRFMTIRGDRLEGIGLKCRMGSGTDCRQGIPREVGN